MTPETEKLIQSIRKIYYPGISNSVLSGKLGISRSRLAGIYSRHRSHLEDCPLGGDANEGSKVKSTADKIKAAQTAYPEYSDNVPARHLPLEKLQPNDCKWPYGVRSPYTFCGCPRVPATPYCEAHNRVAKGGDA